MASPAALSEETRFVGLDDIAASEGQLAGVSSISEVRSRVVLFNADDVLYGRLRPYLRKTAVADFDGAASAEVIVIRCGQNLLPAYLLNILLSDHFTAYVMARAKGDRPRTSFEVIASYEIDIPSLDVQHQVCARASSLTAAFVELTRAKSQHENACAELLQATRTRLIWNSGSAKSLVPLRSLLTSISYGTSKRSTPTAAGLPVLRIPNIANGRIDTSDLKYAPLRGPEVEKYRIQKGDLLMVRSNGSLDLVGRAAVVADAHSAFAFAGYLLRLRPGAELDPEFLWELTLSAPFRRMVERSARSSTGINNLSAKRLGEFKIPSLSVAEQSDIARALSRLRLALERSGERLNDAWLKASELHTKARADWLGQTLTTPPEFVASMLDLSQGPAKDDHKKAGEHLMKDELEKVFLARLSVSTDQSSSFESLVADLSFDYDTMRDAVFNLMQTNPPRVIQIFDTTNRSLKLRFVK